LARSAGPPARLGRVPGSPGRGSGARARDRARRGPRDRL